ncbi:hypothetical protein [Chryseobacterium sp. Leaf394]|uniref:hypothetical protein n=1 Tax=Chryseobacterium sp. Leaf394 TaxID=1736361 RepID=UPI0006FA8E12|nr:hypothetical protein [Chryseobacterium sp. Leaf394]KQS93421.1 hypothetical protein ASG21_00145 [Chryseobacterium sp. Leaf394]
MLRKIISASAICSMSFITAQVGINNSDPKSTLDISKSTVSVVNGLLIPRLTSAEVLAMPVSAAQNSMMVYLTTTVPSANRTGAYINMDSPAHYYYSSTGNVWLKFIDTNTKPTGLERISASATSYGWRLIGATPANYGTLGNYATDLSWNPTNLSETFPYVGTYAAALASTSLTSADMGALGQGSFVTGAFNSAKGGFSTLLGASNKSSTNAHFAVALGGLNTVTGLGSVSIGSQNLSTNTSAISIGLNNTASGESSIAMGIASEATNQNAIALGQGAKSSGTGSVAIGSASNSSGTNSFALGADTKASGNYSFAMGNNSEATNTSSLAIGYQNKATGEYATALGLGTTAGNQGNTVIGEFNAGDASPEPNSSLDRNKKLFVVGNGTSNTNRSDAFSVLRNGKVGVNASDFHILSQASDAVLQVNGNTKTKGLVASFRFGNTINADDYTVVLSGNVTLPTSSAANAGRILNICSDGNSRTLSGTIQDSSGSYSSVGLGTGGGGRCFTLQSVGDGRWWIIGRN